MSIQAHAAVWRSLVAMNQLDPLVHEVLGQAQIQATRLPTDPYNSQIRSVRQLLLRLKWIFECGCTDVSHLPHTSKLTFSGEEIFRLILHIIHLAGSESTTHEAHLDYSVFRQISIETLISVLRAFVSSKHTMTIDEEDLIKSQLEILVDSWRHRQELSRIESVLLTELIPLTITAFQGGDFDNTLGLLRSRYAGYSGTRGSVGETTYPRF